MKKLLVVLLVAVSCISYVGCDSTNNENSNNSQNGNSNNSQQEESEVYTKGRLYYEEIETAFSVLKKDLKNPASLEVRNVIANILENGSIYLYIEYSAENDLGNARTAYIMYSSVTQYCMSGDGTDSAYENYYKIAHGRGKDFVESSKGYFVGENQIVFEVDLSDYENEGYLLP